MLILHAIICYSALLWECITDTWPNKLYASWGQDHVFSTLSPVLNKQLVINRFRFSWAVKDFKATVIAMKNGNFLKPMLITFLKLSSKEKDTAYLFPLCSIERTHQQPLKEERWGGLVWLLGGFSSPPGLWWDLGYLTGWHTYSLKVADIGEMSSTNSEI